MDDVLGPVIEWLSGTGIAIAWGILALIAIVVAIRSPEIIRVVLEHMRENKKTKAEIDLKKRRLDAELERKKLAPPSNTRRRTTK